jgi:hypothetical protein
MGATNETSSGGTYYKLKEDERDTSTSKGELRFFKQEKKSGKWGDGESFNQLSGIVIEVKTKEYEYQGEMKKQLVVVIKDADEKMEFALGMRSITAQGIINTLAGDNGFDLAFFCGKTKERAGKYYPTLYINKPAATKEESRTKWKYSLEEMPKVESITDDDGNKIKKGQKAADEFWLKAVADIQAKLGSFLVVETSAQNTGAKTDDLPF